ncbi:MAG: prepilin peptidase [Alphaproteobacteria bacterium]|nr:prepilin peptidase [Alphaproteobacteria bacterium]MBP7759448.1 prepilin peptidase [Alphaproteobacteria bacterium]MBP7762788.1 prepilin peptidase [Alphaproteobacteria bacterium]MBP7904360.1 prepilin peptidase [Alphaproteobacteria bacterium]
MNTFEILTIVFLGLVFGSFSTALVYRVPRKQNWISKRSACTSCKRLLGFADLVPVFSWFFSGGCCRHCGQGVSWLYPAIEVGVLVLCLIVYKFFGLTGEGIFLMCLTPLLAAMVVIDFQRMILPDQLQFSCLILGITRLGYFSFTNQFHSFSELFLPYLLAAFFYTVLSLALRYIVSMALRKEALGMGDVKLFFIMGFWLGIEWMPVLFIFAGVSGVFLALFWRIVIRKRDFPFGPPLIIALFSLLLLQGPILK